MTSRKSRLMNDTWSSAELKDALKDDVKKSSREGSAYRSSRHKGKKESKDRTEKEMDLALRKQELLKEEEEERQRLKEERRLKREYLASKSSKGYGSAKNDAEKKNRKHKDSPSINEEEITGKRDKKRDSSSKYNPYETEELSGRKEKRRDSHSKTKYNPYEDEDLSGRREKKRDSHSKTKYPYEEEELSGKREKKRESHSKTKSNQYEEVRKINDELSGKRDKRRDSHSKTKYNQYEDEELSGKRDKRRDSRSKYNQYETEELSSKRERKRDSKTKHQYEEEELSGRRERRRDSHSKSKYNQYEEEELSGKRDKRRDSRSKYNQYETEELSSKRERKKDSKTKYQYEEDNEERKLKGVRRREKSEDYKKYSELSKSHSSNDDKNSRRQHAEESNKSPKIRHEPKDSRSKKELQGSSVRETCEASSIDSKKAAEKTTEEYNYDDDEFEDYSDDFDDSSSDNKENEDQSNERTPSDTEGPSRERSPESTEYLHHSRDPQKNVADVKSNYPRSYATMEVTSTLPRIFNKADVIRLNWRPKLLTKLILLDTSVEQELFEMSPTSQYELYIRNFGQANYKQAFVQTGYDSVDRDIQTEECEMHDKWTQHPPIGRFSSGGNQPNRSEGEHQVSKPKFDSVKLHKFLFHATRVMAVLLEEELPDNKFMIKQSENSSQLNFCSGYFTLGTCPIFGNQSVSHCCCTSNNFTDFLMTTHNNVKIYKNKDSINGRNFLGIWDLKQPSKPSKILSSESQINNCCFGPSNSKLVCAGCEDGSILLWDTREAESLHQSVQFDGASYTVRLPAYNTAGVMLFNCHQAPIQSVCHVPRQSYSLKDASQLSLEAELSFQLLSMDCVGVINIWVVVALTSVQLQGSLTELGLKPGSKVKLVHSSTVNVQNPLRNAVSTSVFQTHQLCLLPHNPNQIYIATDTGHVVHSVRLGTIPYPRVYYPTKICDTGAISEVLTIDFTPFKLPCFLTGYSDGNIHLYHTSRGLRLWKIFLNIFYYLLLYISKEYAINSWPLFMTGVSSITQVRWSKTRPCVFYVIADHSVIFVFDLLQHHNKPVHRRTIENRITAMELFCNSSEENDNIALNEKMILCLSSGKTEIQTLSTPFSQPQHLEWEFLEKYLERF